MLIDSDRARTLSINTIAGQLLRKVQVDEGDNIVSGLSEGAYFVEGLKVISL